jgi:hypothetical protein
VVGFQRRKRLELKKYKINDYKEAMLLVSFDSGLLQHVRPDLITPELALEAVTCRGWALEFVPAHCQTQEVIKAALKYDPGAKQFIKIKEIFKNALEEALDE